MFNSEKGKRHDITRGGKKDDGESGGIYNEGGEGTKGWGEERFGEGKSDRSAMMGVKRSAKKSDREVDAPRAPFCLSRTFRPNVHISLLYPAKIGGIRPSPYGAHMAKPLAAFIRHEIRKMRAIMASQLSRTRLVIY